MRLSRFLWLLIVPLFFTACGLSDQQKADYASVQRSGVAPATYDKMFHGDPLSVADIENLSRARVSDAVVLRYMRDQGTIYTLNSNDVLRLGKAGVSQSVIDYMLQTARFYGSNPYYGYPYPDPLFYGPYGPYGPGFGFYGGYGFGFYHGYGGYHGGYHGGGGGYHH